MIEADLDLVYDTLVKNMSTSGHRNNFEEVNRRIQLSCTAFRKLRESVHPTKPKDESHNQCVLPVMTYGAET
jgi:hypothetical protein